MRKKGDAPRGGFSLYRIRRDGKTYGCLTGGAGGLLEDYYDNKFTYCPSPYLRLSHAASANSLYLEQDGAA